MDMEEKIRILSGAAKYDVSCASSGARRENHGGTGNTCVGGICHSWSDDGRCISLLKLLLTNRCIHDCAYCVNRRSNDIPRAAFTPEELADLTLQFYRRNYIEGLFLSSGVFPSPNATMENLTRVAERLRTVHRFYGYIHLKAIPGADEELIRRAGRFADRLSVNIELPSEKSLKLLAPQKQKTDILTPMAFIGKTIRETKLERKTDKKVPRFASAGQSTQLIVGASPDSDRQILNLAEGLYKKFSLKRVYYSAYSHVNDDSRLPAVTTPPLRREHRLYQADWLIRLYGFQVNELLNESAPFLSEQFDPKTMWALNNLQLFPVDINQADYETLIRVPGIGFTSAHRIVAARRFGALDFEQVRRIGVVLKRAQYFIQCRGYFPKVFQPEPEPDPLGLPAVGTVSPPATTALTATKAPVAEQMEFAL